MADTSASVALASALAVASVAGSISVFNLLVNKDQKISEYRQTWLENVRSDVAMLVSQVHLLFGHLSMLSASVDKPFDQESYIKRTAPIYDLINQANTRLKLWLNKTKPEHNAVIESIEKLESILGNVDTFRARVAGGSHAQLSAEVAAASDALVNSASILIKTTWERVKAGEPIYQVGKWLMIILTLLVIALLAATHWIK